MKNLLIFFFASFIYSVTAIDDTDTFASCAKTRSWIGISQLVEKLSDSKYEDPILYKLSMRCFDESPYDVFTEAGLKVLCLDKVKRKDFLKRISPCLNFAATLNSMEPTIVGSIHHNECADDFSKEDEHQMELAKANFKAYSPKFHAMYIKCLDDIVHDAFTVEGAKFICSSKAKRDEFIAKVLPCIIKNII